VTWLDAVELQTVVVYLDSGPSLKGLKQVVHDDCLILRDALVLHENDAPEQLDGLQVIPRERVVLIQALTN
jgi:hypothetical protein